jgi:capsid portal protein
MKLKEENKKTGKKEKMVTLLIVSGNGHDEKNMTTSEALEEIKTQVKNKGKFAYINNEYVDIDNLLPEDIASADDIVLTAALGGGV